jgi:hypothetical protein
MWIPPQTHFPDCLQSIAAIGQSGPTLVLIHIVSHASDDAARQERFGCEWDTSPFPGAKTNDDPGQSSNHRTEGGVRPIEFGMWQQFKHKGTRHCSCGGCRDYHSKEKARDRPEKANRKHSVIGPAPCCLTAKVCYPQNPKLSWHNAWAIVASPTDVFLSLSPPWRKGRPVEGSAASRHDVFQGRALVGFPPDRELFFIAPPARSTTRHTWIERHLHD